MNWILALLAFAGLMTILSTIVYIIVEALHKGLSLRRSGLAEMLRALHDHVVVGLDEDDETFVASKRPKGNSENAISFAKSMQDSPTYAGKGRFWWPSNWGLGINQRKFERMSRLQLAEQLAQTDFGKKLARKNRTQIEFAMGRLGYEFDRFGEAQSSYFRRRAKVMSGLVGFVFVVLANINVIDMYLHLAKDEQSLNSALSALSADNPDELAVLKNNLENASRELSASLEKEGVTSEQALSAAKELQVYLTNMQGGLDLPIGRNYFPYCSDPLIDSRRCSSEIGDSFKLFYVFEIKAPPTIVRLANHWQTGLYWFFCMIASAGLLALGAPFWFDLFSKLAAMVGAIATNRIAAAGGEKKSEAVAEPVAKKQFDRSSNPTASEMADALIIAAGVPMHETHMSDLIGMKLGSASSDAVRAEHETFAKADMMSDTPVVPKPASSSTTSQPIRGVRGDWSAG